MGSKPWTSGSRCQIKDLIPAQNSLKTSRQFPTNPGGGKRDRTADLLHAMQALSQLSYTPGLSDAASFPANRRALNYSPKIRPVSNPVSDFQSRQHVVAGHQFQNRIQRGGLRRAHDQ